VVASLLQVASYQEVVASFLEAYSYQEEVDASLEVLEAFFMVAILIRELQHLYQALLILLVHSDLKV